MFKTIIPKQWLNENKEVKNFYSKSEKFITVCKAVSGLKVKEISEETGMSVRYIYEQKKKEDNFNVSDF